ncbi:MAG: hypothetical protein ACXVIG_05975 [Halobacteriota archaeon]
MNKKQQFLELRAQERSLRSIEKEIGVNRRTLAKWESEHKEELENLKAIELEAMREEYLLTSRGRVELIGGQLKRLIEEMDRRDLSDIPTPKLLELILKLSTSLNVEFPAPRIESDDEIRERKLERTTLEQLSSCASQPLMQ